MPPTPSGPAESSPTRQLTIELNVPARMRDGVTLRANVFKPAGTGRWPTLLMRLPYGKDHLHELLWLDPIHAAREGFMVVVQDSRGRFDSEGDWDPFRFERQDGHDSVEWAAQLPGSNGAVGMFGLSYHGNTQWLAALERPSALAAIAPGMTWSDPADGFLRRGGAFELGLGLAWSLATGMGQVSRIAGSTEEERVTILDRLIDAYDSLTAGGYTEARGGALDSFADLRRPELGNVGALFQPSTGEACRVAGSYGDVGVPTFHVAGWHDLFVQGTLDSFEAMKEAGGDPSLVIGPWTHGGFSEPIGELTFGVRSWMIGVPAHDGLDVPGLQLDWFRSHLAPAHRREDADRPRVRAFVMGINEWRTGEKWPLAETSQERWLAGSDGLLGPDSKRGGELAFVADPGDPVPTLGGAIQMAGGYAAGPVDQSSIERRADVCVFTSEPLARDLEVMGRVLVHFHGVSSAPSADWVARLCDVFPDGRSINLCDGILRVEGSAQELELRVIDLWSTCNVFRAGHRIRLQIAASSFPRWDLVGDSPATQRIFCGPDHPTCVELPIARKP